MSSRFPGRRLSRSIFSRILVSLFLSMPISVIGAEKEGGEGSEARAVAVIREIGDSNVSGVVTFRRSEMGVQVTGTLEGVPPRPHTLRIYETNQCECGPEDCAGGVLDPASEVPQPVTKQGRQAGDFGVLEPDANGEIGISFVRKDLRFHGTERGIVGRALALHTASPAGWVPGVAETRVGCGVIRLQVRDPIE